MIRGFHSINVPSEWGRNLLNFDLSFSEVSIQLMSPASGDFTGNETLINAAKKRVSIQLMSPASGDVHGRFTGKFTGRSRFPFN